MSRSETGPLASYNSLTDPNLMGYFTNRRLRQHLRKTGLVTPDGRVVTETMYRMYWARREQQQKMHQILANAILTKAVDMERTREAEIRKKIDEISKMELVRRMRDEEQQRRRENTLPLLAPRAESHSAVTRSGTIDSLNRQAVSNDSTTNRRTRSAGPSRTTRTSRSGSRDRDTSNFSSRDSSNEPNESRRPMTSTQRKKYPTRYDFLPYHETPRELVGFMPTPPKGQRTTSASARGSGRRVTSAKQNQTMQRSESFHQPMSQCTVKMHYFGTSLKLDTSIDFDSMGDLITIEQQPAGGGSLVVFRDHVKRGSDFSFDSRRDRSYPFSLTLYINSQQDCRLSTCCEYKHRPGARLGGRLGHFGIVKIDGSGPCYRCQFDKEESKKSKKGKKPKQDGEQKAKNKSKKTKQEEDDNIDAQNSYAKKNSKKKTKVESGAGLKISMEDVDEEEDQPYGDDIDSAADDKSNHDIKSVTSETSNTTGSDSVRSDRSRQDASTPTNADHYSRESFDESSERDERCQSSDNHHTDDGSSSEEETNSLTRKNDKDLDNSEERELISSTKFVIEPATPERRNSVTSANGSVRNSGSGRNSRVDSRNSKRSSDRSRSRSKSSSRSKGSSSSSSRSRSSDRSSNSSRQRREEPVKPDDKDADKRLVVDAIVNDADALSADLFEGWDNSDEYDGEKTTDVDGDRRSDQETAPGDEPETQAATDRSDRGTVEKGGSSKDRQLNADERLDTNDDADLKYQTFRVFQPSDDDVRKDETKEESEEKPESSTVDGDESQKDDVSALNADQKRGGEKADSSARDEEKVQETKDHNSDDESSSNNSSCSDSSSCSSSRSSSSSSSCSDDDEEDKSSDNR